MIKNILNWFKQAVPNPTIENACVQIGCHYEEVSEMLVATGYFNPQNPISNLGHKYKAKIHMYLKGIERLTDDQKTELLDALCDQAITAQGVAYMLGMDFEGALEEVNKSNWSKFEDGKPVFDKNGKITKGKDYFKPDLSEFLENNDD